MLFLKKEEEEQYEVPHSSFHIPLLDTNVNPIYEKKKKKAGLPTLSSAVTTLNLKLKITAS